MKNFYNYNIYEVKKYHFKNYFSLNKVRIFRNGNKMTETVLLMLATLINDLFNFTP